MGPKKKGGKGPGLIIDGVDTSGMTREQLEAFCIRIKEENEREREERNYFQMERDKLRTFWEITRCELEEARAKLRNKDRLIEESAEKNDEELKKYKQKVKHMQFEHQNNLTECKAESLVSLKKAQDDHSEQERELLRDKKNLKDSMKEQQLSHEDQIKSLKLQHSEEISEIKRNFENNAHEVEMKYERKFEDLKTELSIKHEMEIGEIEERKNTQIAELTKHHERAFNEIKNYYNDITLNNLALISSLKDQMEVLRKQNERMSKQVANLNAENKKLIEPLRQAQEDVAEYKRQLTNYQKDKQSLIFTKNTLTQTTKDLEDLQWLHDALTLRFDNLMHENKELRKNFFDAVLEVQQKTGIKNVLLQKRIESLIGKIELKEAVIGELQATTKAPPKTNQKLEEILAKKNSFISDLQYELARVYKAHDDLLRTYEDKLVQYGIPKQELGFTPLQVIPDGQGGLAQGPASLVTKKA